MSLLAIELESVCSRRGNTTVADDLSLKVEAGEVVSLLGPSGAGKSSLLRLVLGLTAPEKGIVRIAGRVASNGKELPVPPEARGLGVVFQHLALWPHLSIHGNLDFVLRSAQIPRAERSQRVLEMLDQVGLLRHSERFPGNLSGGEQQRVALARALVARPRALLLDEPLSNLDVVLKSELLNLLQDLLKQNHVAAIYVTHDPNEASHLSERWLVLEEGRLTADDSVQALRAQDRQGFVKQLLRRLSP